MSPTDWTRLVIAAMYLSVGMVAWWTSCHKTLLVPVLRFGATVCGVWAVWYLFLIVVDPHPEPWAGHVNRFLHLGWVAFVLAVVASVRIIIKVRRTGEPIKSRVLGT